MSTFAKQPLPSRKIFVGGLSSTTTQETLTTHFSQYGTVHDCILMMDRNTGRSRCFGFVTMRDSQVVDEILSREQVLDGKRIDCKRAVPIDNNQAAMPENMSQYRTKKMFIGGLPPDITEELFRDFFLRFGELEDSVVMFDRDTGRPRGFGFITFASEDSVERVLENYEHNYINGKWVECKKATPKIANQADGMKGYSAYGGMPYMMYPNMNMYGYYDMYQQYDQSYMMGGETKVDETANLGSPINEFNIQAIQPEGFSKDEELHQNFIDNLLGEHQDEDTYSFRVGQDLLRDSTSGKSFLQLTQNHFDQLGVVRSS